MPIDALHRAGPLLVGLALLGGCGGGAPPPSPSLSAAGPTAQLRVGFPPRGLVDTVEVDALERLPLRIAELIAPDGAAAAPASYINVVDQPRAATGQWALSQSWQDALTAGNALPAMALTGAQFGGSLRGETQVLAIASVAEITLPDPVAYRRDWAHYRIRLTFGTPPGEVETREIPAPAPPPGGPPPPPG